MILQEVVIFKLCSPDDNIKLLNIAMLVVMNIARLKLPSYR